MAKYSESIEKVGNNAKEAGKKIGNIMVGVDIDVSDALKGLKAVQREAKKTARLLREVEGETVLKNLSDGEIFKEIASRGWDIEHSVLKDEFGNPYMSSVKMSKNYKSK